MRATVREFQKRLLKWYDASHRQLPWRLDPSNGVTKLDPYHVLLSESMLQQTQVKTVIPYFHRFLQRFPTIKNLAAADEQDVLRLWQGLGYYSRARNLRYAAQMIVDHFNGLIPSTVDELRKLPGVGRYTAGAIASIAHETPAPIVDGNVARVLCRLDAIRTDPRDKQTLEILWARAEQILPKTRVGDFNSSLMELGAMICTPRSPACLACPVQKHCEAFAKGIQDQIPPPRKTKENPLEKRWVFCLRYKDELLIEQRPAKGRWAGMWQFPTVVAPDSGTPKSALKKLGFQTESLKPLGQVTHALTHRRYEFQAFACHLKRRITPAKRRWVTKNDLDHYPLSRPQLQILSFLSPSPLVRIMRH